ncbi:hypothetical protein Bca101_010499 [Brassica carinata]
MAMKANGKSPITSYYDEKFMFFRDVSLGPHETQLRFRLIHFWEAWNPIKKTLIGLEMLLIDKQGTVIQGFISPGRSSNKSVYRVSAHAVTVSFSWNSELSVLLDSTTPFDEDRFRFHSYEEFEANCDLKGDLYGADSLSVDSNNFVNNIGPDNTNRCDAAATIQGCSEVFKPIPLQTDPLVNTKKL